MSQEFFSNRYFRAGVGTVIYRSDGQVAWFLRAKYPVGVWQFQQGGIDLGEDIETTLWRELAEETGLTQADFTNITPLPEWTVYQDTTSITDHNKSRLGQAHCWFFLQLSLTVTIDLTKATDAEFSCVNWIDFPTAIAATDLTKQGVYQRLFAFFTETIKPTL